MIPSTCQFCHHPYTTLQAKDAEERVCFECLSLRDAISHAQPATLARILEYLSTVLISKQKNLGCGKVERRPRSD